MYVKDIDNKFVFKCAMKWFDKHDKRHQIKPEFQAKILIQIAQSINDVEFLEGAKLQFFGIEEEASVEKVDDFFKKIIEIVVLGKSAIIETVDI